VGRSLRPCPGVTWMHHAGVKRRQHAPSETLRLTTNQWQAKISAWLRREWLFHVERGTSPIGNRTSLRPDIERHSPDMNVDVVDDELPPGFVVARLDRLVGIIVAWKPQHQRSIEHVVSRDPQVRWKLDSAYDVQRSGAFWSVCSGSTWGTTTWRGHTAGLRWRPRPVRSAERNRRPSPVPSAAGICLAVSSTSTQEPRDQWFVCPSGSEPYENYGLDSVIRESRSSSIRDC
jgi:hypothetical protein